MKQIAPLIIVFLLHFLTSCEDKALILKQAQDKSVANFFENLNDWENSHQNIKQNLKDIDSLFNNVNTYEYDSTLLQIDLDADSLKYLKDFEKGFDKLTTFKYKAGNATFWRDSIDGFLLLEYQIYPNPTKTDGYKLSIRKRDQE